jgi:hypothetical protein
MTSADLQDIKTILNEQFDLIQRLMPLVHLQDDKDYQDIYEDILECNNVMMEIVSGPTGGIEKLVERNL